MGPRNVPPAPTCFCENERGEVDDLTSDPWGLVERQPAPPIKLFDQANQDLGIGGACLDVHSPIEANAILEFPLGAT